MIERAADILRRGGLVAFPTETVYGLGADARNANAVAKIFAAKGRPSTNPLIVHVHSLESADRYARGGLNATAIELAEHFWPGPLTLVVAKSDEIVDAVAAGGSTVGLRVPNHPIGLELLKVFDGPIAAPSANRSNRISPTTAAHVREELGDRVDLIVDGGACDVGIESTVLDLTTATPTILRPGGVSRAQLEAVIGPVTERTAVLSAETVATSPGQQAVHYSPTTPTFWVNGTATVPQFIGRSVWILLRRKLAHPEDIRMPSEPQAYARELYAILRLADSKRVDRILIEIPPEHPEWGAVRDRILRAARPLRV